MYCGYCYERAPISIKREELTPQDDCVVNGYYFCGWCRDVKTQSELVTRADQRSMNPVFRGVSEYQTQRSESA